MTKRLARLSMIRRARGFHLYTTSGKRYLDLWQADGRAILGHRRTKVDAAFTEALSQGLAAPLPSKHLRRLESALRGLFPEHPILWLVAEGGANDGPVGEGPERVWRPFLPAERDRETRGSAAVEPVLPYPLAPTPRLVCARGDLGLSGSTKLETQVSPPVLAGLARAASDLETALLQPLPRSYERAPELISEELFQVEGPYLSFRGSETEYERLFDRCLEKGVVLNPRHDLPSIVPGVLSDGETALIRRALGRRIS